MNIKEIIEVLDFYSESGNDEGRRAKELKQKLKNQFMPKGITADSDMSINSGDTI